MVAFKLRGNKTTSPGYQGTDARMSFELNYAVKIKKGGQKCQNQ